MSTTAPWQYSSSSSSLIRSSCSSISVHPLIFANRKHALSTSYTFPRVHYTTLCCGTGSSNAKQRSVKKVTGSENLVTVGKIVNLLKKKNKRNKLLNEKLKSLFGKRALWRRIFYASKKVRSIILLNVITLIYASDIPVLKEVEAIIDPATFTVVRFVVSAIPFLPFALRSWDDVETRNSGIELGFWVSLGYLTQALGLLTSEAGRASFISMFTVIMVPLIDGMLGSVIPTRTWFGALMSIIGVGMLECSGSPPCVGDLFNFLSALFFGIHMLRTEHISRKTDKHNFLPVLSYEVCVVALSSIIWYVVGCAADGSLEYHPSSWTWEMFSIWFLEFPWVPALYTGVFSTGLCLWIEMTAMCDISATETAVIYGLEPVWGAGFAWFLLGERWGISGWFGAALVLSGSLIVQIIGASSSTSSIKPDSSHNKEDIVHLSNRQNRLSATPIPVNSRKDVSNLLSK